MIEYRDIVKLSNREYVLIETKKIKIDDDDLEIFVYDSSYKKLVVQD